MRPLIVDLGREFRGGQEQALLLVKGLKSRGHDPELITVRDSLLASRAADAGISTHGVDSDWRRLGAARAIRRLVRAGRADVVHAGEPHALTSAWLAGAHRKVPVVVSRRVELPLSSNWFSLARYRSAKCVVPVSEFVRESMAGSGLPADQVEVIHVGVEIPNKVSAAEREAARKRFSIGEDEVCLGNVAAFVPEKGHVLLLRALAELGPRFPNCVLLLAGSGREKENLQKLARDLGIEEALRFPGFVADVESVYAATDLFIFPSHQEPLACAMLSAMAYGLPVVAFARGGNPEALVDGQNGLLVGEFSSRALADAISRMLMRPDEARRLGDAARQTAIERFSADHMVDATLKLYERLLRRN